MFNAAPAEDPAVARIADALLRRLPADRPVLVAGPTGSGKSALAAAIVDRGGGIVVNADALQVYAGWRILTARPSPAEEGARPHALYGHVPADADHSVGDWLRALGPILSGRLRPVIVGGTGLYFQALTGGLADIPPVPDSVRAAAADRPLAVMVAELDGETAARIDLANPARVRRAWEVLRATGRGLSAWQADTPPPLLPRAAAMALAVRLPVATLDARIARRFDSMLDAGLVAEARAMAAAWDPALLSARAIGAAAMVAHVAGHLPLDAAREEVVLRSRQYAKRQRTWLRARAADWDSVTF